MKEASKVYAVDICNTETQLMDGTMVVPKGGWVELTEEEKTHPDVVLAKRRGWIKLSPTEPVAEQAPENVPDLDIEEPPSNGSETPPKTAKTNKLGEMLKPKG